MIFYEPLPLYEAYTFLCDLSSGFSSSAHINKHIMRNPACRAEYTRYLELITALEKRLKEAVPKDKNVLQDMFGLLSDGKKNAENGGLNCSLFDILVPDDYELAFDRETFFAKLNMREEQIPRLIVNAVAPADLNVDINDTKIIFKLINESGASNNAKFLLSDVVFDPHKYISMLEEILLAVAKEFEACRSIWEELLIPYKESFSNVTVDAKLLYEKFDITFDNACTYSIYPSITGFRECLFNTIDDDPTRAICYVGVLFDRFRRNENNEASRASLASHMLYVLGDPTRFNILLKLAERSAYGRELATEMGITPSAISEHLAILLGVGLVTSKGDGRKVYYSINYSRFGHLLELLKLLFMKNDPSVEKTPDETDKG